MQSFCKKQRYFRSTVALFASLVFCSPFTRVCAQEGSGFKYIEVKVVDPEGKPLADVEVYVKIDGMEFPMPTNAKGMISLNASSGKNSRLELSVKHDKYAAVSASWVGGKSLPEEFSVPLKLGIPMGGLVHDEQGQPIEGVKIEATTPGNSQADGKLRLLLRGHLATTDKEGRWQFQTSADAKQQLLLRLSHEDYLSDRSYRQRASWEQLQKLDHVMALKKGLELRGRVTDPEGEPIVGATVFLGSSRYIGSDAMKKQLAKTDDDGNYRFGNVPAGNTIVTVAARGWAPELRTVVARKDGEAVDFQLRPGKAIRVLATDPDGVPIAGVGISADNWRSHRSLPEALYRGKTNADGIWQSDSMPADEVDFDLYLRGHMSSRDNKLVASDELHTIIMQWPVTVSGRVVDAESGLPLEIFDIVHGLDWGNGNTQAHWERYNVKQGTNGKYQTVFDEPRAGHYVRIEAARYRPGISRVIRDNEGDVTINFEMEAGEGPKGVVKTPDGKLATGAQLFVATRNEGLYFRNGREESNRKTPHATADEKGKYVLPFLEEKFALVCLHDSGWARLTGEQVEKARDVRLNAWSTVEGTVQAGKNPLAGEQLRLYYNEAYVQDAPRVYRDYQAQSDGEGKFKFDHVVGSEAVVSRSISFGDTGQGMSMSTYSHGEQAKLIPGETTQVQIGGSGRGIKGQIKVPQDNDQEVVWSMCSVQLYEQTQRANAGGFLQSLGRALAGGSRTPQKPTFRRSYASAVDAEGGFAIADMQPGQYQMTIQLYSLAVNGQQHWQPIGMLHQAITISEVKEENDQDPLDLGEFTLQMTKPTPPSAARGSFQLSPAPVE